MRILFLTHRVPYPPDKGDRIRSYNIIKFLSKFHSVALMSVSHEAIHPRNLEVLHRYCESVEFFKISPLVGKIKSCFHLFTQSPLTLPFFYSRAFHNSVARKLRGGQFDLVYVYSSSMAQYVFGAENIPKLMDFIDVDSEKWLNYAARATQPMKWIYGTEGARLRLFEKKVASFCDQVIFASSNEQEAFRRIVPENRSVTVTNGVTSNRPSSCSRRSNKVVFVGSMDYLPNIDAMAYFVREILPLIQSEIPGVELFIVGRNPSRRVEALGRVRNVVVTGAVGSVVPYLHGAAASVIPLRIARGIQNKVLEAMAQGVPVITTSAALEGIEARPGDEVLIGDDPRSFAAMTVAVLKDAGLRKRLSRNGFALVREKYDWERNLSMLNEMIANVCAG
jgi:sugar transferase (PEP-CTERM/EpsH1 system associated)